MSVLSCTRCRPSWQTTALATSVTDNLKCQTLKTYGSPFNLYDKGIRSPGRCKMLSFVCWPPEGWLRTEWSIKLQMYEACERGLVQKPTNCITLHPGKASTCWALQLHIHTFILISPKYTPSTAKSIISILKVSSTTKTPHTVYSILKTHISHIIYASYFFLLSLKSKQKQTNSFIQRV